MWFRKDKETPALKKRFVNDELIAAKAELARLQELPEEDFTRFVGYQLRHGVDEKPKKIARQKSKVAELQVLSDHQVKEVTYD